MTDRSLIDVDVVRRADGRTPGRAPARPGPSGGWATPDELPPPEPPPESRGARLRRRALLTGLAGAGVGAVAYGGTRSGPGTFPDVVVPPPPPPNESRPAAVSAAEANEFANRDESFARSVGAPAAAPAPEAPAQPTRLFRTAGEAAARTQVTVPTLLPADRSDLHLLRRATFGPTPELVAEVEAKGIDGWLAEQLDPDSIDDAEADGIQAQFPLANATPAEIRGQIERFGWDAMIAYGQATLARQVFSRRQLFEVMVDFWGDHLHVATPGEGAWDVAASYHDDVIRRHALGSFTDMLLAANRHPAMLRYLTNETSSKESVNENLGRELLELHTVGVQSGYTEEDVRNSAYILTGRTVVGEMMMMQGQGEESTFLYDPARHWTGPVRVLDFQHENASAEGGLELGDAYLRYLATHPSTATTIARKLAVRFVSDDPPQELVDRLATTFRESGTEIVPVLDVLFRSGEFWEAVGQKTRRPLENMVASLRVVGVRPGNDSQAPFEGLYWAAGQMGHAPLAWQAPNGYPDVQAAWRSANGMLEGWNIHRGVVQGWWDGLTYTPPEQLVGDRPRATVGEYVDSLCERLCFQTFQPQHRDTLIAFLEADAGTPSDQADLDTMVEHLAPLVLDSPYFALR